MNQYYDADHLGFLQIETINHIKNLDSFIEDLIESGFATEYDKKEINKKLKNILYKINSRIENNNE